MIVIADTSPLNYLILIGEIRLIPLLFDHVLIPREVLRELTCAATPDRVRAWASDLPEWCEVRDLVSTADAELLGLDAGERDAILLAIECGVDTLLMDEIEGRREAIKRNLQVTGTVGILEKAAQRGWLDLREAIGRLDQTNFRLSEKLRRLLLPPER